MIKKSERFKPIDIVTTASANTSDITNAVKLLPGTQQVGEAKVCLYEGYYGN